MVRCGACRNQFDVPGAGRFQCPVCGSVNVVRSAPGADPNNPAAPPVANSSPPPPRPPDPPSPRVQCGACQFSFIVGAVATARCPNCGSDVDTGQAPAQT